MKMTLNKAKKYFHIDKLVIHSLDMSLYQASVVIDDEEWFLTEQDGQLVRAWSFIEIQKRCRNIDAIERVMRQESAYDEMVGGPDKPISNAMEIPLGDNKLY